MKLDGTDKKLISLLQNDSKQTSKQLSLQLNLSVTAVYERIKKLEKEGVIKKYIAIRPEIKDYIVNNFEIPEEQVDIIYNPIDSDKFKPNSSIKTENK